MVKKKVPHKVRMFHVEHSPVDVYPFEQAAYEAAGWSRLPPELNAGNGSRTDETVKPKTQEVN